MGKGKEDENTRHGRSRAEEDMTPPPAPFEPKENMNSAGRERRWRRQKDTVQPEMTMPANENGEDKSAVVGKHQRETECGADEDQRGATIGYYELACMPAALSPDPRVRMDEALKIVAEQVRADPTLPADEMDGEQPRQDAYSETAAVHLPRKHCAMKTAIGMGKQT